MKVLEIMPNFGLAGAEIMAENLMYGLRELGDEPVAVSLYDFRSAITDRLEAAGVPIRFLGKKPGFDSSLIGRLRALVVRERPDAIHTHLYVLPYVVAAAKRYCKKNGCRIFHTVHNVAAREQGRLGRTLCRRYFGRGTATPVAISPVVRETILTEYGLRKERVPMIYNGVDLSRYRPKTDYRQADPVGILHIGRFMPQKNHALLLRAFADLRKSVHAELTLIGDGPLREETERLADELGVADCVRFLGTQSDVAGYLHDADLFVLPSVYEGMPMTLIEAMATGLPIIASRVGGVPDMLADGESALLIEPNEAELGIAFDRFVHDAQLRERIGPKARQSVVRFSSAEMADQYRQLLRS